MERLKEQDIRFEIYDVEDLKSDAKGFLRSDSGTMAWFRDPTGNVLSVIA